eukprot:scaffold6917_cov143-Isochrysis_galbana.AAC.1
MGSQDSTPNAIWRGISTGSMERSGGCEEQLGVCERRGGGAIWRGISRGSMGRSRDCEWAVKSGSGLGRVGGEMDRSYPNHRPLHGMPWSSL